jgi:hypothetical protein
MLVFITLREGNRRRAFKNRVLREGYFNVREIK